MKEALKIIPIGLYFIVGIISLIMALKCLFSIKYLPFHEKAAGKPWAEIEGQLKPVFLSIMRVAGLGFLTLSILLITCPIANYFIQNTFIDYAITIVALIYCTGLFIINYILYKETEAETPWKGSIYTIIVIIVALIISIFNDIKPG